MIGEITVNGVLYRGPSPNYSADWPWKITAFLPSTKRSTGGQPCVASWQTWKRFKTHAEAAAAWADLEALHAITARDGLLWRDGQVIPLPEADQIAQRNGFQYAEQLVRDLSSRNGE